MGYHSHRRWFTSGSDMAFFLVTFTVFAALMTVIAIIFI